MSAEIDWDFAVERWADTMTDVAYEYGREEVATRLRAANNPAFVERVQAYLEYRDEPGKPY